jgi:F-type H+-transporting ATPase subunit a
MMGHQQTYFDLIPYLQGYPGFLINSIFVILILCTLSLIYYFQVRKSANLEIPDAGVTLRNILEVYGQFITNLVNDVIGEKEESEKYVPLIGTIFIYILSANLLGLIPGFGSPTANLLHNFCGAIIVFIVYNYYGIKKHGLSYVKLFTGPFWWLAILFVPIELISHLARPLSLSLRLFGNMTGDHLLQGMFAQLMPILIPAVFLLFGFFVSFLQAFIFAILSVLYINISTTKH